jgi:hypothetical protein
MPCGLSAAGQAERLGFESLWTPAFGLPDGFHVSAAWSQETSLRTGIAVVPAAQMWTPLGLAAQAATLVSSPAGGSSSASARADTGPGSGHRWDSPTGRSR